MRVLGDYEDDEQDDQVILNTCLSNMLNNNRIYESDIERILREFDLLDELDEEIDDGVS